VPQTTAGAGGARAPPDETSNEGAPQIISLYTHIIQFTELRIYK